jgi:outer membrane protein OmpA-like peptidoglycan-associated protein
MRTPLITIPLVAIAIGGFSAACATKGFVKQQVHDVNSKVDTVSQSLEATQERERANEGKITDVDQKAQGAQSTADQANRAAGTADVHAGAANAAANAAGSAAGAAAAKADDVDKASRRLLFTVVLSEDQGKFSSGKAALPDEAKTSIDDMMKKILADPRGAYFEIEGHTDSTGPKELNDQLGLERAEAVKRYIYETYQVPLHKINVISYGADKPVASNKTAEGRAQNRRVVIKVLV